MNTPEVSPIVSEGAKLTQFHISVLSMRMPSLSGMVMRGYELQTLEYEERETN